MTNSQLSPAMLERIDKGVEFLDNYDPEWRNFIELDELNLADGEFCILGQWYNNKFGEDMYVCGYAMATNLIVGGSFDDEVDWAYEHGFSQACDYSFTYDQLTQGWKQVLSEPKNSTKD